MKKRKFFTKKTERIAVISACVLVLLLLIMILVVYRMERPKKPEEPVSREEIVESPAVSVPVPTEAPADEVTYEPAAFDPSWEYAENSAIHTGSAVLYHAKPSLARGITVCVNAGHGTAGGSSVETLCHPDGTPKVTGGTTDAGETYAVAVSTGTELLDGTTEADANLALALVVKERLLEEGYDVLMIREGEDVQLDNIARTLIANHYADCHIALHYDSTETDKGVFFMSVPDSASYRAMEPVASHWQQHDALGNAVVSAIAAQGMELFDGGSLEMDLTQTSYSTIPSIDLEVGDRASDHSESTLLTLAEGIAAGVNHYFS